MDENRRARLERLRWHCRRALLELDIVFQRYWARVGDGVSEQDEAALERLLAMEDHDLWYLVSGRTETDDPQLSDMVGQLRGGTPTPARSQTTQQRV
jgi:succinate dehydrogenase flavin-adding protein (antitoxin of CptAB toxin-antitoxin module)